MFGKVKSFVTSRSAKVGALATGLMLSIPFVAAHADTAADASAATTALTSGFDDTKTIFLSIIGVAVGAAVAIFAIKFGITQGMKFYQKLTSHN